MTTQIWLVVLGAAITVVFTRGSIFQFLRGPMYRAREAEAPIVRFFRDLCSCPLCSGVWVGAALSLAHDHAGAWNYVRALDLLGVGSATAVLSLAAYSAIDWLQAPVWDAAAVPGQVPGAPPAPAQSISTAIPPQVAAAMIARSATLPVAGGQGEKPGG